MNVRQKNLYHLLNGIIGKNGGIKLKGGELGIPVDVLFDAEASLLVEGPGESKYQKKLIRLNL